jgi:hypothetical protein
LDHEPPSATGRPNPDAFKKLPEDLLVTQSARKFSAEANCFEDLYRTFKRWRYPKTDRKGFSGIRTISQDLGANWNGTEANLDARDRDAP